MAANKKHHFVPQFYLRNFGDGNSIALFNLDRKHHVLTASIPAQCQRSYLYGKDLKLEKAFQLLEGAAASTIKQMLDHQYPPGRNTCEHVRLLEFIMLQWGRTPFAGSLFEAAATKAMREKLRDEESLPLDARRSLDQMEWKCSNPIAYTLHATVGKSILLADLQIKLLINRSEIEFVTSDTPAVFFNQWCQRHTQINSAAFMSSGLQIFLPVSPRHAVLLFDADVYRLKDNQPRIYLDSSADIAQINALQLTTAECNLFYTGDPGTGKAIEALPLGARRTAEQMTHVDGAIAHDGLSKLVVMTFRPPDLQLHTSFIRVKDRKCQDPVSERVCTLRPLAARAADRLGWKPPTTRTDRYYLIER